ncbi:hypothetical protein ABIB56_001512 [Glaciihabitans sp. UYNi722]
MPDPNETQPSTQAVRLWLGGDAVSDTNGRRSFTAESKVTAVTVALRVSQEPTDESQAPDAANAIIES